MIYSQNARLSRKKTWISEWFYKKLNFSSIINLKNSTRFFLPDLKKYKNLKTNNRIYTRRKSAASVEATALQQVCHRGETFRLYLALLALWLESCLCLRKTIVLKHCIEATDQYQSIVLKCLLARNLWVYLSKKKNVAFVVCGVGHRESMLQAEPIKKGELH